MDLIRSSVEAISATRTDVIHMTLRGDEEVMGGVEKERESQRTA